MDALSLAHLIATLSLEEQKRFNAYFFQLHGQENPGGERHYRELKSVDFPLEKAKIALSLSLSHDFIIRNANTLAGYVYHLAGRPDTHGDHDWGMHHLWDNLEILMQAVSIARLPEKDALNFNVLVQMLHGESDALIESGYSRKWTHMTANPDRSLVQTALDAYLPRLSEDLTPSCGAAGGVAPLFEEIPLQNGNLPRDFALKLAQNAISQGGVLEADTHWANFPPLLRKYEEGMPCFGHVYVEGGVLLSVAELEEEDKPYIYVTRYGHLVDLRVVFQSHPFLNFVFTGDQAMPKEPLIFCLQDLEALSDLEQRVMGTNRLQIEKEKAFQVRELLKTRLGFSDKLIRCLAASALVATGDGAYALLYAQLRGQAISAVDLGEVASDLMKSQSLNQIFQEILTEEDKKPLDVPFLTFLKGDFSSQISRLTDIPVATIGEINRAVSNAIRTLPNEFAPTALRLTFWLAIKGGVLAGSVCMKDHYAPSLKWICPAWNAYL